MAVANEMENKDRLQPNTDAIYPKISEPKKPPRQFIDPIQLSSSFVNAPEKSGVLFDDNTTSAGEIDPTISPCPNIIKFAVKIQMKKKNN